ncbi:replicator initiator [Gluconobacter sp. Dm-44]|nr:replicator initiator [Gluconobacter sp. Dm-44]
MRVWKSADAEAAAKRGRRTLSDDAKAMRGKITLARQDIGRHFAAVTRAKILAVWTEASYYLPLSDKAVRYLTFMLQETEAEDWSGRWLPIFGRSNSDMSEILGIGTTQLKTLARELIDAGLILPHGEGRRYVRRDFRDSGRITHAVGFDLSPLALRVDELSQVAKERRALERSIKRLRREARHEAYECQALCCDGPQAPQIRDLAQVAKSARDPAAIQAALSRLQAIRIELDDALASEFSDNNDPERSVSRPSIIPTTPISLEKTVTIRRSPERASDIAASNDAPNRAKEKENDSPSLSVAPSALLDDAIKEARLSPRELIRLVPSLGQYAGIYDPNAAPSWAALLDGAERLSAQMGVSRDAWASGCITLGRKAAVVAVALMASRIEGHFQVSKGGYFRGLIRAAEDGSLNLMPSIYGMRDRCSVVLH